MKKKHVPQPRYNPVIQAHRLDKLSEKINKHARDLDMISRLHERHVDHLSNFARHDMKNAIQSMDSILSTTSSDEYTDDVIQTLRTNLKHIRETLSNFSKLVPYAIDGRFTIDTLLVGCQLLTRSELYQKEIQSDFEFPRTSDILISQPFQGLILMLHNLVINSIKALENSEYKNLRVKAEIKDEECIIKVADSGTPILDKDKDDIFSYGFTTTNGTGIGLYHAKYLCEKIGGTIKVQSNPDKLFTKEFTIKFPITNNQSL